MTWVDDLLGIKDVYANGVVTAPRRTALNLIGGAGVAISAVDNPLTKATDVTFAAAEDWKESVTVATAAALAAYTRSGNILTATANGAMPAVDGVTLAVGDRFLLKDGANAPDNGIYSVTSVGSVSTPWSATRAADADTSAEVTSGMRVPVTIGATYGGRTFRLITPDPIVLNTTSLSFGIDTGLPNGSATTDTVQWAGTTWTPTSNPTFSTLGLSGSSITWASAATSPTIKQADTTAASATGQTLTIQAQNATGATAFGGTLELRSGTGTTVNGNVRIKNGNTLAIDIYPGGPIAMYSPAFLWDANVSAPSFSQNDIGTASATGQTFTIHAQNATGTTSTGGVLKLQSGSGTSAPGNIEVWLGSFQGLTISKVATYAGFSAPGGNAGFGFYCNGAGQQYFIQATNGSIDFSTPFISTGVGGAAWTMQIGSTALTPKILQFEPSSDIATQTFTLQAQNAYASAVTNKNGGALKLAGGSKVSTGTNGPVQIYSGASLVGTFQFFGTSPGLSFSNAADAVIASFDPTSDVAAAKMTISAANAWASATTNINGAAVELYSGIRKSGSAGLSGPIRAVLNATETMFEATEVASGRRALALLRMSNITTTELPANSGDGVLYIGNVATAPTAGPVSGGLAWVDTGALRWRDPNGCVTQAVYRASTAQGTTKQLDRQAAYLQTTNATVTTIFSYTIPDNSVAFVRAQVCARNQTTAEQGAYFIRHAARRRSAGAAALVGTLAKDAFEEQVAWDVTTAVSGNTIQIQVTGAASQTIDWQCWADVYIWTP